MVLQGGGPTPVLNASLYGVLDEARKHSQINRVLGACYGVHGLLNGDVIDLTALSAATLQQLRLTPGASLGSTRHKQADADMQRIIGTLAKHDVRLLLLIGGNGSLRGADAIARAADRSGYEISVIGVPKTIDNDIPSTDRCPGFGSAARYVAQAVRDLGMDVRGLPQPVSIFETMGRDVGWLAGASVLAKMDENHAPHLVYQPERAFVADKFLASVDRCVTRLGWAVVVVSEGLKQANGQPVYEAADTSQRDALNRALPGGVGNYLAGLVTRELKIRCRSEKPGLCGRASMLHVSKQDLADAELVGRVGVQSAVAGHHAHMVSLLPLDSAERTKRIPLEHAAGDRCIPEQWLEDSDLGVNEGFLKYIGPIVGDLVDYLVPLRDSLKR